MKYSSCKKNFERQRPLSRFHRRWRVYAFSNVLLPTQRFLFLFLLTVLGNAFQLHCNSFQLSTLHLVRTSGRKNLHRHGGSTDSMDYETDNSTEHEPLFSIGMIADIQYAPIPDGSSFTGTPRYYRHSLEATKHAFEVFRDYERPGIEKTESDDSKSSNGVDFVVNLGDIIDGKCQEIELNGGCLPSPKSFTGETESDQDLWKDLVNHPGMLSLLEIQNAMKSYCSEKRCTDEGRRVLHSYGNHCLYNLNRTELRETLGIPFRSEKSLRGFGSFSKQRKDESEQRNIRSATNDRNVDADDDGDLVGYYSYVYPPSAPNKDDKNSQHSIKFIVLDSYDIALMRRSAEFSKKRKMAVEILKQHNGRNYREGNENSPEGLEGLQKRFVAFNGAVGETQLDWLRDELESTRQENNKQKVIILSHQPIHPGSSNPVCLIWNYDAVLDILREYSDVVVASFSGHAHKGGYALDESSGIHFRVVEAVLESKPPTKTFGILDIYQDRLELHGYGDCESAIYSFATSPKDELGGRKLAVESTISDD